MSLGAASFELESAAWDTGRPVGGRAAAFSATGRFVVFASDSASLVPGDTNGFRDVFLRDRETGKTSRISVSSTGSQANGPSGDGLGMSVTPDGRYVSFFSQASNLVPGDTNGDFDVFVRDTVAGTTERVSVSSAGVQGDRRSIESFLSDDGRFVLFNSEATNLIASQSRVYSLYVRDRLNQTTRVAGLDDPSRRCMAGGFASDGTLAAFTCDGMDIFVRNLATGSIEEVSYPHGTIAYTWVNDLSSDGRYLAFTTDAQVVPADRNGETYDAYLYDRATKTFDLISVNKLGGAANNSSSATSVSDDGRFIAFGSWARDLEGDDGLNSWDGFVRDRAGKKTSRVTGSSYGACCLYDAFFALSSDGSLGLFASDARFVANDYNDKPDVMVAAQLFAAPASFTVQPRTVDFGSVPVGAVSASQTVTIRNTGGSDLPISWIGIAGNDAAEFSRVRNCPAVLPAGQQCTATVTFAPATAGDQTARLVVSAGGSRKSSALSGVAQ